MQGPVGVAQELAGEEDEIGFTVGDDAVGLGRIGDHADGRGGNAGFASNGCGKWDLIAGSNGDFRAGNEAARGAIDQIDAVIAKKARELNGIVNRPAALSPIYGGDASE